MKNLQEGEIITGRIESVLPAEGMPSSAGSIMMRVSNLRVEVPISEVGDIPINNNARHIARRYMGRTAIAKVINTNPLELSIKDAVEEKIQDVTLAVGQEITGTVVWVDRKKAEIEYENCMIMTLPSSEYGYLRVANLAELIKIGQKLTVEITNINEDDVFVSHKKFAHNPWPSIQEKYRIRGQYLARVVKIINAGVFVNLEPGLDVLAAPKPSFFEVHPGDEVSLEITDMDVNAGKIKGIITSQVSTVGRRRQRVV